MDEEVVVLPAPVEVVDNDVSEAADSSEFRR